MERYRRLVAEYLDHLRARNFGVSYNDQQRCLLERFRRFVESRRVREIDDITTEDARQYIIHLQTTPIRNACGNREGRRMSPTTVRGKFLALAMFFRYLLHHNRIMANPFDRLEPPCRGQYLPRTVLTETEMLRLLLAPNTETARGLRDRAMLEMAYSSGLRSGELIQLEVRDVDLVRGRAFIRQGKPRKDRVVPIGRRACEWITRYLTEARPRLRPPAREAALFVSDHSQRLSSGAITKIIKCCARRARLERAVGWHALRHTCATHLLAAGMDIRHIQELLGHNQLHTTEVYTRVFPKDLRAMVTAILGRGRTGKAVAPPPPALYN